VRGAGIAVALSADGASRACPGPGSGPGAGRLAGRPWHGFHLAGASSITAGTRPDDPNDIYPHERRRELRGPRVFAAWLNHDDARSITSIDTHVEEGDRRYGTIDIVGIERPRGNGER